MSKEIKKPPYLVSNEQEEQQVDDLLRPVTVGEMIALVESVSDDISNLMSKVKEIELTQFISLKCMCEKELFDKILFYKSNIFDAIHHMLLDENFSNDKYVEQFEKLKSLGIPENYIVETFGKEYELIVKLRTI